jgi:hypothetical protein
VGPSDLHPTDPAARPVEQRCTLRSAAVEPDRLGGVKDGHAEPHRQLRMITC